LFDCSSFYYTFFEIVWFHLIFVWLWPFDWRCQVDIVAGPDAYRDLPNLLRTTESGSQVRTRCIVSRSIALEITSLVYSFYCFLSFCVILFNFAYPRSSIFLCYFGPFWPLYCAHS
jgi:hypothetical protein